MPFWLRRIDLHEAPAAVRGGPRGRARAHRAPRRGAARGVRGRPPLRDDARRPRARRGGARRRPRARRRPHRVEGAPAARRLHASPGTTPSSRSSPSTPRSTCARREGLAGAGGGQRLRARDAYWLLGDLDARRAACSRRASSSSGACRPTCGCSRRSTSASCRGTAIPGLARPAGAVRGHAPAVPRGPGARGRRARPREPGRARPRARRQRPGARALRRGRADLPRGRARRGASPARTSAGRTSTSPRATSRPRPAALAARRSSCVACAERPARDRHGAHRSRARRHGRRRPRARGARARRRARDLFRRAGDRWGLASALWRTGRSRARPGRVRRRRRSARGGAAGARRDDSACAGSATRSAPEREDVLERRAATWRPRGAGTPTARELYVRAGDGLGVAALDARAATLLDPR